MNVGLIAYSNNSGLGQMARNFRKFGIVQSQFVIDHPIKGTHSIDFPHTVGSHQPTLEQLQHYIDTCKPRAVIIIETPFNFDFFEYLHRQNIEVFVIPMVDSVSYKQFEPYEQYIKKFLMPTKWGFEFYQTLTGKAHYLPYIIDTDYFKPVIQTEIRADFLHNQGFGGAGFRKGTEQVFTAFTQLKGMCQYTTIWVNSQPCEPQHSQIKPNTPGVLLRIQDCAEARDVYRYGKVYVAPSKREGLGLPILEAMACGLPVITTNAPPMNEWFDDPRLLVKVRGSQFLPYGDISMYTPDVYDLMMKMKWCIDHSDEVEGMGIHNREVIVAKYSYEALKGKYAEVLHVG